MSKNKLTVLELLKKFPNMLDNDNCLTDMVCSQCGNRFCFNVEMTATIQLYDSGTEEHGDTDWGGGSKCACLRCGKSGIVKDFTFKDLDKILKQRKKKLRR